MENSDNIKTVRELLVLLGSERVRLAAYGDGDPSERSGQKPGEKALIQAAWKNEFPAKLFGVVEGLCIQEGIECPRDLFGFQFAHCEGLA
ncbi:MAG: hypothetical protein ABJL67_13195 [Sulfitobacter sp.]